MKSRRFLHHSGQARGKDAHPTCAAETNFMSSRSAAQLDTSPGTTNRSYGDKLNQQQRQVQTSGGIQRRTITVSDVSYATTHTESKIALRQPSAAFQADEDLRQSTTHAPSLATVHGILNIKDPRQSTATEPTLQATKHGLPHDDEALRQSTTHSPPQTEMHHFALSTQNSAPLDPAAIKT